MSRYIIITPVKNEEGFIEKTIASIKRQTLQPVRWVIVNDGSVDGTEAIVRQEMRRYEPIMLVNRTQTVAKRRRGQGVIEAFNEGLAAVQGEAFDFLVKLDGDLMLPSDFFEKIIGEFEKDPRLGIASGVNYSLKNDIWVLEKAARGFTWGATKIYRRQCFEDIGGLVPFMGWDGIDHLKAVMHGWSAKCLEGAPFFQLRPEGKETGFLKTAHEEGVCCYYMGYLPLFFFLRALRRMADYPYIVGGCTMLASYIKCALLQGERINDPKFIAYLRRNQKSRLVSGGDEYTR